MKQLKTVIFFTSLVLTLSALITGCGGAGSGSTNIAGTITGLTAGNSVVLQNNGADTLTVTANGNFAFGGQIKSGSTYAVTVKTNPIGQTCTVANGTGTVGLDSQSVTNLVVTCTGVNGVILGFISGLGTGLTVNIQDHYSAQNGSATNSLTLSTNGVFEFPTTGTPGSSYDVTVTTQPTGQTCTVSNASGTIPDSGGIVAVLVTCQ